MSETATRPNLFDAMDKQIPKADFNTEQRHDIKTMARAGLILLTTLAKNSREQNQSSKELTKRLEMALCATLQTAIEVDRSGKLGKLQETAKEVINGRADQA